MRRRIWAIVGASSGNLVEWFDFTSTLFLLALFCNIIFFPSGNTTTSFCETAGVLPLHFLMRPTVVGCLDALPIDARAQSLNVDFGVHDVHGVARLPFTVTIPSAPGTVAPLLIASAISGALGRGE